MPFLSKYAIAVRVADYVMEGLQSASPQGKCELRFVAQLMQFAPAELLWEALEGTEANDTTFSCLADEYRARLDAEGIVCYQELNLAVQAIDRFCADVLGIDRKTVPGLSEL